MAVDKLVDSAQLDADLTSVANAIRFKADISGELMFPSGFVNAIGSISPSVNIEPLTVTEDGTYTAPEGTAYSPVTVNVSGGGDNEPVAIEPIATDYMGGYVGADGTHWRYEDSTNCRNDVYPITEGHEYELALGDVVGTRFRAVQLRDNPVGTTTDRIEGVAVVAKNNPNPNDSVKFFAAYTGYLVVQKDNASQSGIVTYLTHLGTVGSMDSTLYGTFIGKTNNGTEGPMDIVIPYTGSGYPIAITIFVSEGPYNSQSSFYTLINSRSIAVFSAVKNEITSMPTYSASGANNQATTIALYKNSSNTATNYGVTCSDAIHFFSSENASSVNQYNIAKMKSNTILSVYTGSLANGYKFMNGIQYTYIISYHT